MDVRKLEVIGISFTRDEAKQLFDFLSGLDSIYYPDEVADELYDKLEEVLADGEKAND